MSPEPPAAAARGFLIQTGYRIEEGRPVVRLWGRLESGETFLALEGRERPRFWVSASDAARAAALPGARVAPSERRTLDGRATARIELGIPSEVPALRRRLAGLGVAAWEADVPFATRYLIDRSLRGSVALAGEWSRGRRVDRVYRDPEVTPSDARPPLRVLSLDIETDPRAQRLLSVALCGCGAAEVLLLTPEGVTAPPPARPFVDEAALLRGLVERLRELDPDVLTGWNLVDFDLRVLDRLARRRGVPLTLGRDDAPLRLRPSRSPWRAFEALVSGRAVLDGIDLVRGAFLRFEDYSLDAVAREVLGEGKSLSGSQRAASILEAFERDRRAFVEYNLRDARLVEGILDRLGLLRLAVERSRLTGMPLERVSASVASFDFLYLAELARQGRVASFAARSPGEAAGEDFGGHVLEPVVGLHRNVLAFDFRSLYPSLIRSFQIDPVGHLLAPAADAIVAPNGATFRREPGILPRLLDELMPRREEALARGDSVAAHAIKILMNSFYGVLGTPTSRFFQPAVAGAITSFGREVLLWTKARFEARGLQVLYGDTDSLFVLSGRAVAADAESDGRRLAAELNAELAEHLRHRWRVESRLELRFERLYRRLMFPPARRGGGARKRYAGLVGDGDGELVFRGMESVRSDWTPLARDLQRELYGRLFRDRALDAWLREQAAALRAGRLDERLVYRKRLRKPAGDYTATTPPHVAAARLAGRTGRGPIAYLMTTAGPEPVDRRQHPIDYEHYVQRQLRPVAEPVLALLGLDFEKVIGDDAQLELF